MVQKKIIPEELADISYENFLSQKNINNEFSNKIAFLEEQQTKLENQIKQIREEESILNGLDELASISNIFASVINKSFLSKSLVFI